MMKNDNETSKLMRSLFSIIFSVSFFLLCICGGVFFADGAFAASVVTASDTVSSHTVSAGSNHAIEFISPTGVESSTDTIVLDFSSYDLSGISVADIDLSHGPTTGLENTETLASSASAGVWGVAISGTEIIFTAPTNAGAGEISASSVIRILVGTNASGGSNQILNPSTAGQYLLSISGLFGDTGEVGLAVLDSGDVSVTASYPAPPSSSGGGPSRDTIAPIISDVSFTSTTEHSVIVRWVTDEYATSEVDFGHAYPYASGTVSLVDYQTVHEISLEFLEPCQTYTVRIRSSDYASNERQSFEHVFTTLCDVTAPIISQIEVYNVTDSGALISWMTNEPATTVLHFGNNSVNDQVITIPGYTTRHVVSLIGLSLHEEYAYQIFSADPNGNMASSSIRFFQTMTDQTPPTNVYFSAEGFDARIRLQWSFPIDQDAAGVRILRRTDRFPMNPFDGDFVYQGTDTSFIDTSLQNGTRYYYAAFVFDVSGLFSSGALASAIPSADVVIEQPDDSEEGIDEPEGSTEVIPGQDIPSPFPEVIPTPGATIQAEFFGAFGSLPLSSLSDGSINVRGNTSVTVRIPLSSMNGEPEMVLLKLEDFVFVLQYNEKTRAYEGTFSLPPFGIYDVRAIAYFSDGRIAEQQIWMRGVEDGIVVQRSLTEKELPVEGARVYLYVKENDEWILWNGARYGQENPIVLGENGKYIFEVEPGTYYAEVRKEGFETRKTDPMYIEGNLFHERIELIPLPFAPEFSDEVTGFVVFSVDSILDRLIYRLLKIQEWLESNFVKEVAREILLPLTIGITVLNIGSAFAFYTLLSYLQYLLALPFLFIRSLLKKGSFGMVVNALTGEGIGLAKVFLLDAETGARIQSVITDKKGRFLLFANPGTYRLSIKKRFYHAESDLLKNTGDGEGLYLGGIVQHAEKGWISPQIAVDPVIPDASHTKLKARALFRALQKGLLSTALLLSAAVALVDTNFLTSSIVITEIIIMLVFKRLSPVVLPKESLGFVYHEKTKKPVSGAVVRMYDSVFHRLTGIALVNKKGQFGFFAKKNAFDLQVEAKGFQTSVHKEVLPKKGRKQSVVSSDVSLKKK